MTNINPYEQIKRLQQMPSSLQDEFNSVANNSLDSSHAQVDREPLYQAYVDNRLRSEKPITYLDFIQDLKSLWESAGKEATIIRHSPSSEDGEFPRITYRMTGRAINPEFKDMKPRLRSSIRHPDNPGEYIELYGQMFDVGVEFSVHSSGAEEADQIAIEFEEFLQTYAGYFKRRGVQEITFHSQNGDEVLQESRITAHKRQLNYIVRFEKMIVRFLNEIEQIAIQANLHHEGEKQ